MEYNSKNIGDRIKKARKAAGFKTQGDFAEKMDLSRESRQTIGRWERGEIIPALCDLLKMCKIFNCELGYLLCEHELKTRENTDVHNSIGISENAIDILQDIKKSDIHDVIFTLSDIIEHPDFRKLLCAIHKHRMIFNQKSLRIDDDYRQAIARSMNCEPNEAESYLETSSQALIESLISQIVSDLDKADSEQKSSNEKVKRHMFEQLKF